MIHIGLVYIKIRSVIRGFAYIFKIFRASKKNLFIHLQHEEYIQIVLNPPIFFTCRDRIVIHTQT
jgi:hypothetical protein